MSTVILSPQRIIEARRIVLMRIDVSALDGARTAAVFARSGERCDPDPHEPYWWCSWRQRFDSDDDLSTVISDSDMTRAQAMALAERHVIGIPEQMRLTLEDAA